MARYIDADALLKAWGIELPKKRPIQGKQSEEFLAFMKKYENHPYYFAILSIYFAESADVVEADKVQKTVETYCTDHCYHNAHCMEMYKDVDDAVEYLERKCEKCPLRELRDLDMRGENNELHK